MSTSPIETPLERAARGERGGVEACIGAYGPLVWSLARRWLGSSAEAEDAVQEVFIEVWKSASRFDPNRATDRGFVAMIARRRLIDRQRKQDRRPDTEQISAKLQVSSSDHERIEGRVMAAPALKALEILPDDRKQFVVLSAVYGMSHQAVADHTGSPLGTVKSGIRRGLLAMREAMENDGFQEVGR